VSEDIIRAAPRPRLRPAAAVAAGTERRKKRDAAFVAIMVDLSMILCTYSVEHEQDENDR